MKSKETKTLGSPPGQELKAFTEILWVLAVGKNNLDTKTRGWGEKPTLKFIDVHQIFQAHRAKGERWLRNILPLVEQTPKVF